MDLPRQAPPVARSAAGSPAPAQRVLASDTCVSVTVNSQNQICLNIPVVGSECLTLPIQVPAGTAAQACIDPCTKWGFPTGACVTVSVFGQQVLRECFGSC